MRMIRTRRIALLAALLLGATASSGVSAQCPEEAPVANFTGVSSVSCPCFVVGEEAGVVLNVPPAHYPIEITRIRIAWGSQFGGAPQSLESAVLLYPAGLPNPGTPQFSLAGPVLTDGFLNEFDLTASPGNKIINSGPFSVSLQFLNSNAGNIFAPSVVHDGNGCQPGKGFIRAIPGGILDSCLVGLTGDWRMEVVYRQVNCPLGSWVARSVSGNPDSYTGDDAVIGSTMSLSVDLTTTGHTCAAIFANDAPASFMLGQGSVVLIGGNPLFTLPLTPGPIASFAPMVPNDPMIAGLTIYTQAVHLFGTTPFALSNAVDFTAGF